MKKLCICLTVLVMVLGVTSSAVARRGTPPLTLLSATPDFKTMDHLVLESPDLDLVFKKDRETVGRVRVAETLPVGRSMDQAGTWETLGDGSHRWRLRVSSAGAYFLAFQLSELKLPPGAEMHFISVERNYYDGPHGASKNNAEGVFGSPMVPGDSALIEVWVPREAKALPNFRIDSVSWGYKNFRNILSVPRRDGREVKFPEKILRVKAACTVDVNCPEADAWQGEVRSSAEGFDGNFICSGQVLNSTDNDCSEYHYLTANHCFSKGKAKSLVFFWNYKNSTCSSNDAPIDLTTTGSTHLANGNASDFFLVRLNEIPPESFFVSQSGFDATGSAPATGVTMGYPNDVPMVIAFENDPITNGLSDGWGDDHWRVETWDLGGTDGGSSGGGLWNEDHRVVGQLHGGIGACDDGWDEFGKLSVSWGAGAAAHLDPGNTGQLTTNQIDCFGGTPPPPPPPCTGGQAGDPCSSNADCCSNDCRTNGKFANTCK